MGQAAEDSDMLAVEDLLLVAAELQRLAKGFLSGDRPFECAVAGRFGELKVVGLRHSRECERKKFPGWRETEARALESCT